MGSMIQMRYVNYRNEEGIRTITPRGIRYGSTRWHPDPQWLLTAWDHDKEAEREFALSECDFLNDGAENG